ncbi:hypothetical protein AMTRI_Chr08g205200 [Amborella trichopoda]
MIGFLKYVFIVLHADDHGERGTFALYSLLNQHINFKNRINGDQTKRLDFDDSNLKNYSGGSLQSKANKLLEKSSMALSFLTFIVLLGTCMVIGDGALTLAIYVLSVVQGMQSRSRKINTNHINTNHVVLLFVTIFLVVFLFQRFGTRKVCFSFSPIMLLWFGSTVAISVYNIFTSYPRVFNALSPYHIYYYFARNHNQGWEMLGAVVLCIRGVEAMFDDMGHFNKLGIQIAISCLVYPCILLTYSREAAYLIKNLENISNTLYSSVSINMFHTSSKYERQVDSPEVNYLCSSASSSKCTWVTVIWVMLITTCLMPVVMLVIWNANIMLIGLFFLGIYMTSLLNKVLQGSSVPFAVSAFFLVIMLLWTYRRRKKHEYEAKLKLSLLDLQQLVKLLNPPKKSFSLRQVMVVVTVQTLLITTVLPMERFLIGKLGPKVVYRCLVQYGYMEHPSMEAYEYVAISNEKLELLETCKDRGRTFVMGRTILRSSEKAGWFLQLMIDGIYQFLQKNFR